MALGWRRNQGIILRKATRKVRSKAVTSSCYAEEKLVYVNITATAWAKMSLLNSQIYTVKDIQILQIKRGSITKQTFSTWRLFACLLCFCFLYFFFYSVFFTFFPPKICKFYDHLTFSITSSLLPSQFRLRSSLSFCMDFTPSWFYPFVRDIIASSLFLFSFPFL